MGEELKKLREDLDMTQDEVADLCGVSRAQVSMVENGNSASWKIAYAIAKKLGRWII